MLVLEVELLTGRFIATSHNDRQTAEWPPHPARLFSALVAAFEQSEERTREKRDALRWLAGQAAPAIYASEATRRSVLTNYVPVNDTSVLGSQIDTELNKLRALERELEAADTENKRLRVQKKLDKQRQKLRDVAIREATRPAGGRAKKKDDSSGAVVPVLPFQRTKQARTFPSVTPEVPTVVYGWNVEPPDSTRDALQAIASDVSRLGHSSTPVRLRVLQRFPEGVEPNWYPNELGSEYMRVTLPDQLQRLESAFHLHRAEKPRLLPFRWQRYGKPTMMDSNERPLTHSVFDDQQWLIFERAGGPPRRDAARYLPMQATATLAGSVRDALIRFAEEAGESLPEQLTGHTPDGRPTEHVHMAVIPLPYVGSKYADGMIRGFALVLPRDSDAGVRKTLLRVINHWEMSARADPELRAMNDAMEIPTIPVYLGSKGVAYFTRLLGQSNMLALRPSRWTRASRVWRTATPVALDRNPGNLHSSNPRVAARAAREAERTVARACERIGLPSPSEVHVGFAPALSGSQHATIFPGFPAKKRSGKPRKVLVHVTVSFDEPVGGPIFLGAGRYYGLGLFLPVHD